MDMFEFMDKHGLKVVIAMWLFGLLVLVCAGVVAIHFIKKLW